MTHLHILLFLYYQLFGVSTKSGEVQPVINIIHALSQIATLNLKFYSQYFFNLTFYVSGFIENSQFMILLI